MFKFQLLDNVKVLTFDFISQGKVVGRTYTESSQGVNIDYTVEVGGNRFNCYIADQDSLVEYQAYVVGGSYER